MNVSDVLAALRREREQIEQVIASLERLELSRGSGSSRTPLDVPAPKKRGRPRGSKNKPKPRSAASPSGDAPAERVMAAGLAASEVNGQA